MGSPGADVLNFHTLRPAYLLLISWSRWWTASDQGKTPITKLQISLCVTTECNIKLEGNFFNKQKQDKQSKQLSFELYRINPTFINHISTHFLHNKHNWHQLNLVQPLDFRCYFFILFPFFFFFMFSSSFLFFIFFSSFSPSSSFFLSSLSSSSYSASWLCLNFNRW